VRFKLRLLNVGKSLIELEAAIGIEPMNKGFAETGRVFGRVPICSLVTNFVGDCGIRASRLITQIRACLDS